MPIPLYYRLPLIYFESTILLISAITVYFTPQSFLHAISPSLSPFLSFPLSTSTTPAIDVLSSELAQLFILTALMNVLVLSTTNSYKTWSAVTVAKAVMEVLHISMVGEREGWQTLYRVDTWGRGELQLLGTPYVMLAIRVLFLLNVGVDAERREVKGLQGKVD